MVTCDWGRVLAGVVLLVVGAIWTFQGYGTLTGSFMTGSPFWMWIGIACVVLGSVVLLTSRPGGGRPSAIGTAGTAVSGDQT